MFKFRVSDLIVLTALVATLISSFDPDGIFHLIFFKGLRGQAFWFFVVPIIAGIYSRLVWQTHHDVAALVVVMTFAIHSAIFYALSVLRDNAGLELMPVDYWPVAIIPAIAYLLLAPLVDYLETTID